MPTELQPDRQEPQHLERLDPSDRQDHEAAQHWARYEWACTFLPADRVLDCSCGVGYGSALLRERGARLVVGVDISPEAIARARQSYLRPGIEYVQADAAALDPAQLGTFDLIVSLETIEHVATPEKVLDAFRSLLEPDGWLVLSCPNDEHLGVDNPYHLWRGDFAQIHGWLAARFPCVDSYAEAHTVGAAVWPLGEIESPPQASKLHQARTRVVDTMPASSAAGYLFICGQNRPPPAPPVGAQLLNGGDYIRELETIKDRLWSEARDIATAWQEQNDRIRELEQEKSRLWAEAQRLGKAWEGQSARIRELEQEKDRTWQEAQRLGEAWESHTAHIRELEANLKARDAELTRLRRAITEHEQRWLHGLLRRMGCLPKVVPDDNIA